MTDNATHQDQTSAKDAGLMMSIAWAISTATRMQGREVDRLRLHDAVSIHQSAIESLAGLEQTDPRSADPIWQTKWQDILRQVATAAGVDAIEVQDSPDAARLPALTYLAGAGWGVIRNLNPQNQWLININGQVIAKSADEDLPCIRLIVQADQRAIAEKPVFQLFKKAFLAQKKIITEAALATVLINLLALMTSLYSMQVYDRVIPTQGYSTLVVLTLGVAIALFFDIVIKVVRSHLMEHTIVQMDKVLSREIFGRLLQVRMDQLPRALVLCQRRCVGMKRFAAFYRPPLFTYLLMHRLV